MTQPPAKRVIPIATPDEYVLPTRAEAGGGDSHRQVQFLMGEDVASFADAMNLQLKLAKDTYRIPLDIDAAVLHKWLHLGGWTIYDSRDAIPALHRAIRSRRVTGRWPAS